jgi:glycosyltransferase involved in cell wall biosynthesis
MKIIYGITKSNWGGAQRYVFDIATSARKEGHDVSVLCGGEGVLKKKLSEAGIRVIPLPYMERDVKLKAEIKSFWGIYKILRAEQPDIFHVNSSKMGAMGALAGWLARVKVIFTAHGWAFHEPRHWAAKMLIEEISWLTVLLSHKTICVSDAVKRAMEDKPFLKDKFVVIKNGIEPFPVSRKKDNGAKIVVGTIAELHRVKGIDVGLRGFARAFKYTDAIYEVIGEGDDRPYIENLIRELGIEAQVKLLGFKENARDYLPEFDIFVLPSRSEALGYVLLEAGIAKLPVVATRIGGIPEIIKDEDTGLLFESQRFQELADKLKILSTNKDEARKYGENLHSFVIEHFGRDKMIKKTLSLYQ